MARVLDGYHGGPQMPLGGFATLLGVFNAGLGGFLYWMKRSRRRLPRRIPTGDLLLVGVATHKLTRTITRDWVTAPVRAAFTEHASDSIEGEVTDKPRGSGLRLAVGELLTCPYCTGPWVAGALLCGLAVAPGPTRLFAGIFAATAISDFLHRAYDAAAHKAEAISHGEPALGGDGARRRDESARS